MGHKIFISYRRGDTEGFAGEIFENLQVCFGADRVFMDVTDISVHENFADAINQAIGSCHVVVLIIGPNWANIEDEMGRKRLDDSHDFSRLEIKAALDRNIKIVPVLVHGAKMPVADDLPFELRSLISFQSVEIRKRRYDADLSSLLDLLERYLGENSDFKPEKRDRKKSTWLWIILAIFAIGMIRFVFWQDVFVNDSADLVNSMVVKTAVELVPSDTVTQEEPTAQPSLTKTLSSVSDNLIFTKIPSPTSTIIPSPTSKIEDVFLTSQYVDPFGVHMILIPQGPFIMGTNNHDPWNLVSEPAIQIGLDMYYIDRYEVANEQYKACVTAGFCRAPLVNRSKTRKSYFDNPLYAQYPVVYVSWWDAVKYCSWRGGRLPSEPEWEKAARGENNFIYPWGDTPVDCEHANHTPIESCAGDTVSVISLQAGSSPYGVLNLSGNVQEWVYDWFQVYPGGDDNFSKEFGTTHRVIRGGSFFDGPNYIQVTSRKGLNPDTASSYVGFRCVLDIKALP